MVSFSNAVAISEHHILSKQCKWVSILTFCMRNGTATWIIWENTWANRKRSRCTDNYRHVQNKWKMNYVLISFSFLLLILCSINYCSTLKVAIATIVKNRNLWRAVEGPVCNAWFDCFFLLSSSAPSLLLLLLLFMCTVNGRYATVDDVMKANHKCLVKMLNWLP